MPGPSTRYRWLTARFKLSDAHLRVLQAMAQGHLLKSHRDLEGHKVYQLHPLDGPPAPVDPAIVAYLCDQGLIDSNKKFPAATYWLTARAREVLAVEPLGVHSVNAPSHTHADQRNV